MLSLSVNGLANRYALVARICSRQLTDLLFAVLFDPLKDSQGLFPANGFQQERRQLFRDVGR